jgi:uncharacterized membrane protein YhiD involved in acid resistance
VLQGLLAGVGFLCAGAILKLEREAQVHGLTTAAGVWMTAAIGIAAGLGREMNSARAGAGHPAGRAVRRCATPDAGRASR